MTKTAQQEREAIVAWLEDMSIERRKLAREFVALGDVKSASSLQQNANLFDFIGGQIQSGKHWENEG